MTVLTASFTRFTLLQLSNLDQKGNDHFSFNVLHFFCSTLTWSKVCDPPVTELKCLNQSLISSRIYSSAECAPQIYTLADIQHYSWKEEKYCYDLWVQTHILPYLEVLTALECSGHVTLDSLGFFFNNLQRSLKFTRGPGWSRGINTNWCVCDLCFS